MKNDRTSLFAADFSSPSDLNEIKELILRTRPLERLNDFPSNIDLDEIFQDKKMVKTTRLWRNPAGVLVAYAFVHFPYNNLVFECMDEYLYAVLGSELLHWAELLMRDRYGADLANNPLDGCCRADDELMNLFFIQNGFTKQEVESLSYLIESFSPPAPPLLPPGFLLRPLDPAREIEPAVALLQAAYGTNNFSLQDRLAMMNTQAYIPELDLVVEAPGGVLAGNCICGIESAPAVDGSLEGFTDPVVVHPQFQRMGIARSLLLSGIAELQQRKVYRVRLGTSSTNTAMRRAAEAAGFRCISRCVWYSKSIS